MHTPGLRLSVALALTSSALLLTLGAPTEVFAAAAPADGLSVAASLKKSADDRRSVRAEIIRQLAEAEFQGNAPTLGKELRKEWLERAALHRGAERTSRVDGEVIAVEHALLKQAMVADQTDDVVRLEAAGYSLPGSLKLQLAVFPELNSIAAPAESGLLARIRFGRELAAEAAKLPAEGRREKLRAFIAERVVKLPKAEAAEDQDALRELFDSKFKCLTEIFGDAIAGLDAAEMLVQLDGYTADAHAKLAEMLARNGRRDAALRALDAALALDPKNERALTWEKVLTENAPELFIGVVEEPADQATLAAAPVWALAGIPPKHRERIAVESAARTMGHRILAALRAPAARREAAVKQAVELHRGLVGVLTEPTRTKLEEAQKEVVAASAARDADKARENFEQAPRETANHVLYWQLRAIRYVLEQRPRDVLDCVFVVQAMEPENAWAKSNRPNFERLASATPKPSPVAREEHTKSYQEMDYQLRAGFYSLVQSQTDGMLAVNPANAEALILRARLKQLQGDRPGAQVDLRAAVAAGGPLLAEARGRLAQVLMGPKAQEAEVAAEVAEALKLSPDQPDALFVQAVMDLRAKKFPEALAFIDHALAARPEFEEAIALRANVLQQTGKSAEAEKWLRDAIAKHPDSVFLRGSLGLRLVAEKKLDEVRVLIAEISRMRHGATDRTVSMLKSALERAERAANPGAAATTPAGATPTPAASGVPGSGDGPRRRPER